MATEKIDKEDWKSYFDSMSVNLQNYRTESIEIQLISNDVGIQPEAQGSELRWIVYDPQNNELEIMIDKMEHMIADPREIYVQKRDGGLSGMQVIQESGVKNIIAVR